MHVMDARTLPVVSIKSAKPLPLATLLNTDGKRVQWRPVGSTGLLRTSGAIDWMSLTEKGLEQLHFDPAKTQPANAVDQCR